MASTILQVFREVYKQIENLSPDINGDIFPFERWAGDTPLEEANGPDLTRSFRVLLDRSTVALTNSSSQTKWFRSRLLIKIGYPESLFEDVDTARLGVEGMIASDIPKVIHAILFKRPSPLAEIGNVRINAPWEATRQTKTILISFDVEWGESF